MPKRKESEKRARSPSSSSDDGALDCIICLDTVVDAHQASCCAALVCGECSKSLKGCCPHCRHKKPAFLQDPFRERQAAALVRTCETCGFSGKLNDLNAHVAAGHESPEDKAQRLEEEVEALEKELKKKKRQVTKLKEAAKAQEVAWHAAVLGQSKSVTSILRAALHPRIDNHKFVICRHKFMDSSGEIEETVERGKDAFEWATRTSGRCASVTVTLLHPDASKDKSTTIEVVDDDDAYGEANWMSIKKMERFRHCGKYIVFGVGFARR